MLYQGNFQRNTYCISLFQKIMPNENKIEVYIRGKSSHHSPLVTYYKRSKGGAWTYCSGAKLNARPHSDKKLSLDSGNERWLMVTDPRCGSSICWNNQNIKIISQSYWPNNRSTNNRAVFQPVCSRDISVDQSSVLSVDESIFHYSYGVSINDWDLCSSNCIFLELNY